MNSTNNMANVLEMEEIANAVCKALEALLVIQVDGNREVMTDLIQIDSQNDGEYSDMYIKPKTTSGKAQKYCKEECFNYFPVKSLIAQLECVLQIAQCILRIERVCFISKCANQNDNQ